MILVPGSFVRAGRVPSNALNSEYPHALLAGFWRFGGASLGMWVVGPIGVVFLPDKVPGRVDRIVNVLTQIGRLPVHLFVSTPSPIFG